MKLTETQKNFRNQMKQYEKEIMNGTDDQYPTNHSRKKGNNLFITVTLWLFIIACFFVVITHCDSFPLKDSPPGEPLTGQVQNQLAANAEENLAASSSPEDYPFENNQLSTNTGTRILTNHEGQTLKLLIECNKAVDEAAELVTYNAVTAGRDNNLYRDSLIKAIATCTEQEQQIVGTYVPEQFENYQKLCLAVLSCEKRAFTCWYDGSLTNDLTLIEQGNSYMNQANDIDHQKMDELENYLKDNGYKYNRSKTEIQFWYRSQ